MFYKATNNQQIKLLVPYTAYYSAKLLITDHVSYKT